jgi:hypothetical protein
MWVSGYCCQIIVAPSIRPTNSRLKPIAPIQAGPASRTLRLN